MWEFRIPALPLLLLSSLLLLLGCGDAAPNCPLLNAFPKPRKLADNASIRGAATNLTAIFDSLAQGNTVVATNNSWSIEVWSLHSQDLLFSHYHTQSNLGSLNSAGVTKVDANTVYRLGSMTKIFTVYNWLATDGDIKWNTPITKFVPELVTIESEQAEDPVANNDWDAITIGALLSQMSGLIRDYSLLGELTQTYPQGLETAGFPPLSRADTPQCGQWPLCNRTEFFEGLRKLPPTVAPESQPAYSNIAYQLLGYALEGITGKSWETILAEKVLQPLNLQHTYYQRPNQTRDSIIPGNLTETGWWTLLGDEGPAGSMYSSAGDLTRLGRAILSSELLPAAVTQRWLKPVSFTSDPQAGLGAPWGIRRINLGGHVYRHTYAYQKAGRIGRYASLFILLPDYDVGFTILNAGDMPVNLNFEMADYMGEQLIPRFEQAAKDEAAALYAGEYFAADAALNSSVAVVADDKPGLAVTRWLSNGTDMSRVAVQLRIQASPSKPSVRLYPTGLETVKADGSRRVAFKAGFEDESSAARVGKMFSTDCALWLAMTSEAYGSLPLDEFVFNIDASGKVTSVEPIALRIALNKET